MWPFPEFGEKGSRSCPASEHFHCGGEVDIVIRELCHAVTVLLSLYLGAPRALIARIFIEFILPWVLVLVSRKLIIDLGPLQWL